MSVANENSSPWWAKSLADAAHEIDASTEGLSSRQAAQRLRRYGPNTLHGKKALSVLALLLRQLGSPIVLILIAASVLSFAIRDALDGFIILFIVSASSLLGFWQEYRAVMAVERLQQMVEVRADVLREGKAVTVPVDEVVPGDVILLSAGSSVPADCRLIESRDLFTNEATLTGETFPVEKNVDNLTADAPLAQRSNALFQGTHVNSGTGRALVMRTGSNTEFGAIAQRLRIRPD